MINIIGVIGFMIGLTFYVVGLVRLRQLPSLKTVLPWECPDATCPRSFTHARFLVTHIMDVHPRLAHLTTARLELRDE